MRPNFSILAHETLARRTAAGFLHSLGDSLWGWFGNPDGIFCPSFFSSNSLVLTERGITSDITRVLGICYLGGVMRPNLTSPLHVAHANRAAEVLVV